MERTVHETNKNAEAFQLKRLYVFSKTQGRFNQNASTFYSKCTCV